MSNYDASPMMADRRIDIEEVEALIQVEAKPIARDARKIVHLLKRVHITINAYRQQIRSLNNDIQIMRNQSERAGMATTLNPRDAIKFLSPAQLSEHLEGHMREQLQVAERTVAEAKRARASANAELHRVRFAVASITEDPYIPADVRDRFIQGLADFQESPQQPEQPQAPRHAAPQNPNPQSRVEDLGDLFD